MASNGKRKTTMAKLTRERKLIERRIEKQARKQARKAAGTDPVAGAGTAVVTDETAETTDETSDMSDQSPQASVELARPSAG